ncbi:MAG: Ig-like domain-containing protein [Lachnospiraceae bacterium]
MKNGKIRIAVIAVICVMILAIAPAFLVGALKTGSLTMTVGDNAQIELTNPVLQMIAKYEVVDGNMIATEPGGKVEAYGPGETEVEIKVPFRTMKCKVSVLGFESDEATMLTGQTCKPQIAGASSEAEFYSSDESVIRIENGNLVTVQDGDATVICSDKGLEVTQTIHVAGIVADKPYLFAGNQMQLSTNDKISGTPKGWTTQDSSIATIDENGVITGVNAGTAVVTCQTGDNETLETTVNVVDMKDSDLFLQTGEEYSSPLTSGEGFDAVGIEWKSADRNIVRVDESGNIKAVNGGETQVTCSIDGQEISGKVHVMTMPSQAFTAVGMDSVLEVANAGDNQVTWASSDESKVKVENGVLKGVGAGKATITATAEDRTFSCDVSIVQMSESSLKMDEENTKTVSVMGVEDQEITWTSQDESIAIVDENGEVTPVGVGSTVVNCSIGPSTMSIPVTVEEEDVDKEQSDDTDKTESETAEEKTKDTSESKDAQAQSKDTGTETKEEDTAKKTTTSAKKTTSSEKTTTKKTTSSEKTTTTKKTTSSKKTTTTKTTTSSKVKEPETVKNTSGQLTGPEAMVACGNYYNSVLENAVKKGEKWVYSNSSKYVAQSGTFEDMLSRKIRGGNCASIANWAFRDMGLISSSEKFYGDGNGNIRNYNSGSKKLKSKLDANCEIINAKQKSFGTLMKEGKIEVGDVIIGKGHTYVYRGNGTVFASGHDAIWHKDKSVKTEDSNKAVFESWIRKYKGTYDEKFKVHYIIRIKDSFVPKYYRDENGNLVKNR